jgi:hypothetical protein
VAASPPSPHPARPRRLYSEEDLTALSTRAAEAAVARFAQSISTGSGLLGPAFSQGPTFAHLPSPGESSLLSSSCLLGPSPFPPLSLFLSSWAGTWVPCTFSSRHFWGRACGFGLVDTLGVLHPLGA